MCARWRPRHAGQPALGAWTSATRPHVCLRWRPRHAAHADAGSGLKCALVCGGRAAAAARPFFAAGFAGGGAAALATAASAFLTAGVAFDTRGLPPSLRLYLPLLLELLWKARCTLEDGTRVLKTLASFRDDEPGQTVHGA